MPSLSVLQSGASPPLRTDAPSIPKQKQEKSLLPFARSFENKPEELGPPYASQRRNMLHKMRDSDVPVVGREPCVRNAVDQEPEQPMSQIALTPLPAALLPRQARCCLLFLSLESAGLFASQAVVYRNSSQLQSSQSTTEPNALSRSQKHFLIPRRVSLKRCRTASCGSV